MKIRSDVGALLAAGSSDTDHRRGSEPGGAAQAARSMKAAIRRRALAAIARTGALPVTRRRGGFPLPMKVRPKIGAAPAAGLAHEPRFQIGEPHLVRPWVCADRGRIAALVILTVDKHAAHAGGAPILGLRPGSCGTSQSRRADHGGRLGRRAPCVQERGQDSPDPFLCNGGSVFKAPVS